MQEKYRRHKRGSTKVTVAGRVQEELKVQLLYDKRIRKYDVFVMVTLLPRRLGFNVSNQVHTKLSSPHTTRMAGSSASTRRTIFSVPSTTLPIANSAEVYPIRRIYCVGRNYTDHTKEMGGNPDREVPFFFSKPRDAVTSAKRIPYPPATANLHYEMELVVALGAGGSYVPIQSAMDLVYGYAAGVDLTRRDLQAQAKDLGRPWDASKGFDQSAPIGLIHPRDAVEEDSLHEWDMTLRVNGIEKQRCKLGQMIWSVPETIFILSTLFRLEAGDLIFTGTPSGVGPLEKEDKVEGIVSGLTPVLFQVT